MTQPKSNTDDDVLLWDYPTTQRQLGGIHRGTVDRLVQRGKLVRIKVGERSMITKASALALIQHAEH